MQAITSFLAKARQRQDVVFALFFVMIMTMLVLPLPIVVVDTLLAVNLVLSLTVLMTATYLKHPLELSSFPAIILLTTLLRVALSVATTRLILSTGDAGHLILAFGNFVIAGNIVVGLVTFLIIAIVQFMVVTKGAERISEVSARFTLDAMPGKQMAIDNDLRNGDIDKAEARRRRTLLEQEIQFHGSMDGAMRFVKGDAIASLIIVAVNLIGGLAVGMTQRGMSFGEAGRLYTLLSVGDGLIAQIPSMFIAVAAGVIVTRVTTETSSDLGREILSQIGAEPRAVALAGGVALGMALIPGFPTSVFLTLGALLLAVSATALGWRGFGPARRRGSDPEAPEPEEEPPPLRQFESGDSIAVIGHPEFLDLLRPARVFEPVLRRREEFARTMGFEPPSSGYAFDPALPFGEVRLELYGIPVDRFAVEDAAPGQPLTDEQAEFFSGRIAAVRHRHVGELLGVPEVARWLAASEPSCGRLATDIQQHLPLMTLVEVLRLLLEDGIGLKHPKPILEGLLLTHSSQSSADMAEALRKRLKAHISYAKAGPDGALDAVVADPAVEDALSGSYGPGHDPAAVRRGDERLQQFVKLVASMRGADPDGSARTVVVCRPEVRRSLQSQLRQAGEVVSVIAYDEIVPGLRVRNLAAS